MTPIPHDARNVREAGLSDRDCCTPTDFLLAREGYQCYILIK